MKHPSSLSTVIRVGGERLNFIAESTLHTPHGGAKRRRGSGGRLDTRFDDATLGALRTRAKRPGLAPSTWVRTVVRDALHASRSEELDAAVAAHLLGVEARVQASADAREPGRSGAPAGDQRQRPGPACTGR